MIDTDKIRKMTALAVYDDKYGEKDRAVASYNLRDYVYKSNCITRILVFIGFLAGLFFYVIHMAAFGYRNIAEMDLALTGVILTVIFIGIMVGYTLLGRHLSRKRYFEAKSRLSIYYTLLKELYGG